MTETFSDSDNILLNIQGGLKIKDLTDREIEILEKEIGEDWFENLGLLNLDMRNLSAKTEYKKK